MSKKSSGNNTQPFLTDIKTLRERARKHLNDGGVTHSYTGDPAKAIEISCRPFWRRSWYCVLRYTMHAVAATGISSEGVKAEFDEHAKDESEHARAVAERINQLGGQPNYNPKGLESRSASQFGKADNLIDMIKENLIAERIAVDHYRELIRYFGHKDPGTRKMIEEILIKEEEHANDMHD